MGREEGARVTADRRRAAPREEEEGAAWPVCSRLAAGGAAERSAPPRPGVAGTRRERARRGPEGLAGGRGRPRGQRRGGLRAMAPRAPAAARPAPPATSARRAVPEMRPGARGAAARGEVRCDPGCGASWGDRREHTRSAGVGEKREETARAALTRSWIADLRRPQTGLPADDLGDAEGGAVLRRAAAGPAGFVQSAIPTSFPGRDDFLG
jgi:hypothetical protein